MVEETPGAGTPTGTPAKAEGEVKQDAPPAAPPAGNTTAEGTKPKAPESYDLKLPENSGLDKSDLDKIAATAKAQGLSQEDAQKLVERDNETLKAYSDRQQAKMDAERNAWINALNADKELGGDNLPKVAELSKRVIDRFASPELKAALESTGLGNHPELVRFVHRIGKLMANDTTVLGGPTAQAKREPKDVLYPQTASK